jgi:hypothetical protein
LRCRRCDLPVAKSERDSMYHVSQLNEHFPLLLFDDNGLGGSLTHFSRY